MMTVLERQRLERTMALNDEAGEALLEGDYDRAVAKLVLAAAITPTARQALLDRALEAAEMGVSSEAVAAKVRRGKSA